MRIVALAAVAAVVAGPAIAADFSQPPPAGDPIYAPKSMTLVGHLELGVGFINSNSDNAGMFAGAGRVNIPLHNDWNIQADLNAAAVFQSGGYSTVGAGPAVHVWHRGAQGAVGVFGGVLFGGATTGFGGAEATVDVSPSTTLGIQASAGSTSAGSSHATYWNVRGWGNFYFTPDTKLRGDLGYTSAPGASVWNVAATLEHRFTASPMSVFGRVAYVNGSGNGSSASAWSGAVGLRLFLDPPGTTLRDHDHMVPWDAQGLQVFASPPV